MTLRTAILVYEALWAAGGILVIVFSHLWEIPIPLNMLIGFTYSLAFWRGFTCSST